MSDALEDIFDKDERKKETVKLYPASCPGYFPKNETIPITEVTRADLVKRSIAPHKYYSVVGPRDRGKDYACEDCARYYARDDQLRGLR